MTTPQEKGQLRQEALKSYQEAERPLRERCETARQEALEVYNRNREAALTLYYAEIARIDALPEEGEHATAPTEEVKDATGEPAPPAREPDSLPGIYPPTGSGDRSGDHGAPGAGAASPRRRKKP